MAVFSFSKLPPTLLEAVISKVLFPYFILLVFQLDLTSYPRLQQTCRAMRDLPRNNHRIKVYSEKELSRGVEVEDDGRRGHVSICSKFIHFVGVQFSSFGIPRSLFIFNSSQVLFLAFCLDDEEFESNYKELKEHRITCNRLEFERRIILDTQRCVQLLNILKPSNIKMDSEYSNLFEALFQAKQRVSPTLYN